MRPAQNLDKVRLGMVIAGRAFLGIVLSGVLSVIGIGIAWGMFVFSGAVSHATLLALFMTGAGAGAGLGSILAWIRVDQIPPRTFLLLAAWVLLLAGTGGAWGGYQFGANQEVECCVGPLITPVTYTALGATVIANAAALMLGIAYETKVRGRQAMPRVTPGGPGVEARRAARRSSP